MANTIEIEAGKLDVLIRQLSELNKAVRAHEIRNIFVEVLNGSEAAKYLKVSPRFLQTLREKGEIRFIQRDSVVRYRKIDLDKWLDAHQVGR